MSAPSTHGPGVWASRRWSVDLITNRIGGGCRTSCRSSGNYFWSGSKFGNLVPWYPVIHTLAPNEGIRRNLARSMSRLKLINPNRPLLDSSGCVISIVRHS